MPFELVILNRMYDESVGVAGFHHFEETRIGILCHENHGNPRRFENIMDVQNHVHAIARVDADQHKMKAFRGKRFGERGNVFHNPNNIITQALQLLGNIPGHTGRVLQNQNIAFTHKNSVGM